MKAVKRTVAYLIIFIFLFCLLPPALAANNENVLTSVNHTDSDTYTLTGNGRVITLTVPYNYAGGNTLDLTNGLNIDWDQTRYKQVVATPDPALISINNSDTVKLTVSYNLSSDPEGPLQWKTEYSVRVKKAAAVGPTFFGNVSKEFRYSAGVHTAEFTYEDFKSKYEKNDGAVIGTIAITGSNPSFGKIQVANDSGTFVDYNLETHPKLSINPALPDNTVLFRFEATSKGTVSYNISAFEGSKTVPVGNVVATITFYDDPQINTPIAEDISKGTVKTFSESYFASRCNLNGLPLNSVVITPVTTAAGVWSLGTLPFTTATTVPAAQLRNLTFTANEADTAAFTWYVTTMAGASAPGNGTFTVTSPKLTLFPYNSTASSTSVLKGSTWRVYPQHFSYTPSLASLAYVKITSVPAAVDGHLYLSTALPKNDTYGYPAIAANTALNANAVIPAAYLNSLWLATKNDSKNSQISFMWTATTDMKVSAAVWGEPVGYTAAFRYAQDLQYATDMNIPVTFSDINAKFSAASGAFPLSYVTFTLPDKTKGSLYLNYDLTKKTGTAVTAAGKYYASKTPNIAHITFVPAKDFTGSLEINYAAYAEDGTYISGKVKIAVAINAGGTFSYMTDKNSPLQFDANDFQTAFLSATGKALSHVRFSPLPASRDGYLCYNYTLAGDYDSTVSSGYPYYVYKAQYLSLVTFVPHEDVTGSVVIPYTGYTETGAAYNGKLYVYIVDSPAGIVQYSVRENSSVKLSGNDFSKEFIGVTGSLMSHVTFTTPPAESGSLYYKYDAGTGTGIKVTTATKYYDGKVPDISDITFIPAKDFTGMCVVPYTGYTTSGASYAGKLKFAVFEGSNVITYKTETGKPVSMNSSSFAEAFFFNSGGKTLSYVTFQAPSASYGRFYYNYSSALKYDYVASGSNKFYLTAAPYLSGVSFVPQEGYVGSFTVIYTGYTSTGISITGKIKIIVRAAAGGSISYETDSMTPVTFKAADFVTAYTGKTGNPLYYVRFTQPNASFGTLYESYNPQVSYNTPINPSKNYYANYSTSISSVAFVPNPSFSGVLSIGYTAYDSYGQSSTGSIIITVNSNEIGTITYGINLNTPVLFGSDDFNAAFLNKTGSALYGVTFTLPPSSAGTLYLGYNSPTSYTSTVSSLTKYYRSYSPLLSNISFVPKTGYSGVVTIPYTGYTVSNAVYYGKIIINVGTAVPYIDMDKHDWAKDAVDYLYQNGVITNDGSGHFNPGANMTRGDFMVMIANAFYLTGTSSGSFPDVPVGSRYYNAIAAAKAFDIARGDDTGLFHPEWGLSRQDAMVIIVRALKNTGIPLTPGTKNNLAAFPDASQVADYAVSDIAALVRNGYVEGSGGRLHPKTTFTRAESAMLLYRILIM